MDYSPTPEQQAIIDAGLNTKANLMIEALAGCAKTTSIEMLARALPPSLPTLYLVFNKRNKEEAEKRLPGHVTVKTFNGLGHSAWSRGRKITLDDRKVGKLVTEISRSRRFDLSSDEWATVRDMVNEAQLRGMVPNSYPQLGRCEDSKEEWQSIADKFNANGKADRFAELAHQTLERSIQAAFGGIITYNDQIYMPTLFGGDFPRFQMVMVDEAQDLNALQHTMVRLVSASRIVVVGDSRQAIYAWRGAHSQSMNAIRAMRKEWIDLELNTTFRCPRRIVNRQQDHAPGFQAAESNHDGVVLKLEDKWEWRDINFMPPNSTTAILCRNNAPLLRLAFKLIRQRVGVQMLGRDIGKGLVALSKQILPHDGADPQVCTHTINKWRDVQLANAGDDPAKADGVNDRADCLIAVLESGAISSGDLRAKLEDLFSRQAAKITLSSIHKAKGLEWDLVVHLDPWRIPSKQAKAAGGDTLKQEYNLRYVCETRTKHTLVLANLDDFS